MSICVRFVCTVTGRFIKFFTAGLFVWMMKENQFPVGFFHLSGPRDSWNQLRQKRCTFFSVAQDFLSKGPKAAGPPVPYLESHLQSAGWFPAACKVPHLHYPKTLLVKFCIPHVLRRKSRCLLAFVTSGGLSLATKSLWSKSITVHADQSYTSMSGLSLDAILTFWLDNNSAPRSRLLNSFPGLNLDLRSSAEPVNQWKPKKRIGDSLSHLISDIIIIYIQFL